MSKPALTCGKCDAGWICERHADQPWPRDQCPGPAMPCDVAACPNRVKPRPVEKRTGLGYMRCHQAVATIGDEGAGAVSFKCLRCGYRWSTDHAAPMLTPWPVLDWRGPRQPARGRHV
jgi:hypothetical protein